MSSIAKISVEKFDNKDQILYDFNKAKGLTENIRNICKKICLPESHVYGLKHQPTKKNPASNFYVTEKNYAEIKHSDCLKVVFSISFLTERILNNLFIEHMRDICFEDLLKLSTDPAFIDEMVGSGRTNEIIDAFIEQKLKNSERHALLLTIVHLFQKGYIRDTSKNILKKTLDILNNENTTEGELKYSLSLLYKILTTKNKNFDEWKEKIIQKLPIQQLIPYIWSDDSMDLQYASILLINTIIRSCKGDKKEQLIKEMNLKQNRQYIYDNIIMKRNFDKNMEHELYVIQTFILGLFSEALHSDISLTADIREEFELCSKDIRRLTCLMDFDENIDEKHLSTSTETLPKFDDQQRVSLVSILSDESNRTSRASRNISESDSNINAISLVTLECLKHYKRFHYTNFYQSQAEETVYEPGIFASSERVVKMLAKILHIGVDTPDSKSTFYQPIVFYCSKKTPFFHELFSRTMWLLSKTRREMRATTIADYLKVMNILEKQIKMVLNTKPLDFKALTELMANVTFETAIAQIQSEKEQEMRHIIDTNPCIQDLKKMLKTQNESIVVRQRINCLLTGSHFPRVLEKKTSGNIFVQLSKNEREIHVYDIEDLRKKNDMTLTQNLTVSNITHVVIGKNCEHANRCTNPRLAFSIIINHNNEEQLKFIAKDERNACYWTDALNILIGSTGRSKYFEEELNDLIEMDVRLKLLDLQNVKIPSRAPKVPTEPIQIKPPIPQKPAKLSGKLENRKKHK